MLDFTHQERQVIWVLLLSAILGAVVLTWQELAGAARWEMLLEEEYATGNTGSQSRLSGSPVYLWAVFLPRLPETIPPGKWLLIDLDRVKPAGPATPVNLSGDLSESHDLTATSDDPASDQRSNRHPSGRTGKPRTIDAPIDINRASASQLQILPGIGPVLAERIIQLRLERGSFTTPEELLEVKGIGPKKFEKIKDLITVGGS